MRLRRYRKVTRSDPVVGVLRTNAAHQYAGDYFTVETPKIDFTLISRKRIGVLVRQRMVTDPYEAWPSAGPAPVRGGSLNNTLKDKVLNFAPGLGFPMGLMIRQLSVAALAFSTQRIKLPVWISLRRRRLITRQNAIPVEAVVVRATSICVGGSLRSHNSPHYAVLVECPTAAQRQLGFGVWLPRIAKPPPISLPKHQPGSSGPASKH